MQIALRPGQLDLVIVQSAQAVSDGGNTLAKHGSIGDDKRVGLQLFLVLLDVVPEADAPDFFFPFDQDLYVDGKLAVYFLQRFERFQVDMDLAFVVGGTASDRKSTRLNSSH